MEFGGAGVGVDIELIDRFEKFNYDKANPFLSRVYSQKELEYCFSRKKSAQHLAVRFAAKEAVLKAMTNLISEKVDYRDIVITHAKRGNPSARIRHKKVFDVLLSMSHSNSHAIAFAVVQKCE